LYNEQLNELPKDYDAAFKKKCNDKIKDKAPSYFLEFVVKAPSLINAINNSPEDSGLRENLLEQLPEVGSGSFLIAPPKLWLTLSIILNQLIIEIKIWADDKIKEAARAERAKKKK